MLLGNLPGPWSVAVGLLVDVFILVMEGMHEALATEKLGFAAAVRRTVSVYALPALAGQLACLGRVIGLRRAHALRRRRKTLPARE